MKNSKKQKMKTLYFDCFSGISGDMIIGALLDLGLDFKFLEKELNKLNIQGYKIEARKVIKNGISATKFDVVESHSHHGNHDHNHERNINEINSIIKRSKLDKN